MSAETRFDHLRGGQIDSRPPDALVARLAERQHRAVARRQLRALGLTTRQIEGRLARGLLHPVHRGVYAVGCRGLSLRGRWMAAVLAGGPGAVLSHRSAAVLWGMLNAARAPIELTAPRPRCLSGLITYRSQLADDEVTVCDGIPVTTAARTILDCSAVLQPPALARMLHEADIRRLDDRTGLQELRRRHRGKRGIAKLHALRPDDDDLRSELEIRFREGIRGLRKPEFNAEIALPNDYVVVDALWREERVVAELDSRAFHHNLQAFERDRERDRHLLLAGFVTVRVTWRQHDSAIADLHRLLGERRESP